MARKKNGEVCTQDLSYFSRLSEATSFAHAALVETHRRGLERATEVCAVQDGAEWLQGLVDYQRANAVRILDFPHAAQYISEIGEAMRATGGRLPAGWLAGVLHRLKQEGPVRVLKHLTWLAAHSPSSLIQEKLSYLQKREAHMQYPSYQQAGWPIGSGSAESANKLVVEARHVWSRDARASAQRQSDAGTAQRGLQWALEPDVGVVAGAATRAAHATAASRQPAATEPRLLGPHLLGHTAQALVCSLGDHGQRSDGSAPPKATSCVW